jgi:hypothetical protein
MALPLSIQLRHVAVAGVMILGLALAIVILEPWPPPACVEESKIAENVKNSEPLKSQIMEELRRSAKI